MLPLLTYTTGASQTSSETKENTQHTLNNEYLYINR